MLTILSQGPIATRLTMDLVDSAVGGLSVIQTSRFVVRDAIARGELVELLRDYS